EHRMLQVGSSNEQPASRAAAVTPLGPQSQVPSPTGAHPQSRRLRPHLISASVVVIAQLSKSKVFFAFSVMQSTWFEFGPGARASTDWLGCALVSRSLESKQVKL